MSEDTPHDNDQWWLAALPRMLVWSRLRVLDSGVAEVFDCDGRINVYESEDVARAALMDAEFRALDGMDADDAEARAAEARQPYELVLLDHQMPELDGLGVARAILDTPALGHPALVGGRGRRRRREEHRPDQLLERAAARGGGEELRQHRREDPARQPASRGIRTACRGESLPSFWRSEPWHW